MKTFYAIFTALLVSAATSPASYADSGFGEGFTGDSPAALTGTVVSDDTIDMDDAAVMFNETEPAAGDENTTDYMAPMSETEMLAVPENMTMDMESEDSIDTVIIKSIHQE